VEEGDIEDFEEQVDREGLGPGELAASGLVIHYYSGSGNYWRRLAMFELNEGERKKFLEKWHFCGWAQT
jgi:hypothetical protein